MLTNSNGSKTKSYSYNAFGVEYNEATLDDNPFRYCGEYYDKETQTIYLRARYYNAEQGRFTQEDPIRDGYNWYSYCGGNSVNCIDPTGYSAAKCDLQSETNPNKFLNFGPSGGGANQYMKVVADAITVIAITALITYGADSTADNPPLPMNKFIAMEEAKAEAKTEVDATVETDTKANNDRKEDGGQVYFPQNPYNFNPQGLIMREFPGSFNGRIIKWFDPVTNIPIFEWNEDIEYGSHYHILNNGMHDGTHIKPNSIVPEPFKTIYFGKEIDLIM